MTEQTDRIVTKSLGLFVLLGIVAGLFGFVILPVLVYWQLGKLEPNNLRTLACASTCLVPVVAMISFAFSFMLYKANRKGQDNAIQFAAQSWSEIASGVFKVGQARQAASQPRQQPAGFPAYPAYMVPMPGQLPQPGSEMLIEQRQVPGEFYE